MKSFWQNDKQMHLLVSLLITLGGFPVLGFWSMAVALVVGILKEVADYLSYGLFDVKDVLANSVGIAIGGGTCLLLRLLSLLVRL